MAAGRGVDPYLGFRYRVEIDAVLRGGFTEVDGIEVELETETYEEGGVNDRTHVLPTRASTGNVTLRRGLTDEDDVWSWAKAAVDGRADRQPVRIVVLDTAGLEAVSWQLLGALPVRYAGPDLAAEDGRVALEELELAYERLTRQGGRR